MLIGHFAVGLVAKRVEPKTSLGTTMLAAVLPDVLWGIFLIAGIEHVQIKPRIGAANYLVARDIFLSHSLVMDMVWGGLFAAGYLLARHYLRGALILFLAVLSHWLLDVVSHRADMPLSPGLQRYFGLGLWNSIPATIIVEGGFWIMAAIFYGRATRARNRVGAYGFWSIIALLMIPWYNNIAGPPPASAPAAGWGSLIFFSLVVAWAYWMNRLRSPCKNEVRVLDNAGSD